MAKLVLYTFAIFQQPNESKHNKGFHDRNPFVYVSAENSIGFVDRAGLSWKRNHADRNRSWGVRDGIPRFPTTGADRNTAAPRPQQEPPGASKGSSAAIPAAPTPGGQHDQAHGHPAGYSQRRGST